MISTIVLASLLAIFIVSQILTSVKLFKLSKLVNAEIKPEEDSVGF
jgi:hypothetical protein